MAVNIKLKHSSVDGKAPVAADLENGELALNINENSPAAYIKDSNGDIVQLAGPGSVTDEASVKKVGDNMTGDLTLGAVGTPVNTIEASGNVTLGEANSATIALGFATGTTAQTIQIGTASAGPAVTVNSAGQGGGGATQNVMLLDTPLNIGTSASTPEVSITPAGEASFSGDVTVGTDKITLDAGTGAATFAGQITTGDGSGSTGTSGVGVGNPGYVSISQSNRSSQNCLSIYDTTNAVSTFNVTGSGSASFAGDVVADTIKIQGTGSQAKLDTEVSDFVLSTLNTSGALSEGFRLSGGANPGPGTATFAGGAATISGTGAIGVRNYYNVVTDSAFSCFSGRNYSGTTTSQIYANGAASFQGNVNVGDTTSASGGTQISAAGYLYLRSAAGDAATPVIDVYNLNNTKRAAINADGSIMTRSSLSAADGYSGINASGTIYANRSNGSDVLFSGATYGGGVTSSITAAGSGTFSGNIVAGSSVTAQTTSIFYNNSSSSPAVYCRNYGTSPGLMVEAASAALAFEIRDTSSNSAIAMYGNGSASFAGTVTATVVPPSDARFKENIEPAKPQLADVVALGGLLKNYDWNDQAPLNEEIRSQRQLGLIAQEAEEICPSITKNITRTKQGAMLTPEEIIPAVVEPAHTIPAVTKEVPNPRPTKKGETITVEVTPAQEVPEKVITPEQVIPATYEELDDSYKGISQDALIMKLIGAVAELSAEVTALKSTTA